MGQRWKRAAARLARAPACTPAAAGAPEPPPHARSTHTYKYPPQACHSPLGLGCAVDQLAVVLPNAAARVDREADVGAPFGPRVARLEQVAAEEAAHLAGGGRCCWRRCRRELGRRLLGPRRRRRRGGCVRANCRGWGAAGAARGVSGGRCAKPGEQGGLRAAWKRGACETPGRQHMGPWAGPRRLPGCLGRLPRAIRQTGDAQVRVLGSNPPQHGPAVLSSRATITCGPPAGPVAPPPSRRPPLLRLQGLQCPCGASPLAPA